MLARGFSLQCHRMLGLITLVSFGPSWSCQHQLIFSFSGFHNRIQFAPRGKNVIIRFLVINEKSLLSLIKVRISFHYAEYNTFHIFVRKMFDLSTSNFLLRFLVSLKTFAVSASHKVFRQTYCALQLTLASIWHFLNAICLNHVLVYLSKIPGKYNLTFNFSSLLEYT